MVDSLSTRCMFTSPNGSFSWNEFAKPQLSSHRSPYVFTSLLVLYAIFSTIGFILNVIIAIVIVCLMPRLLTNVTNIFVLTLAFSDIFMCAFNMPIQVFYEKEQLNWSEILCRVLFSTFGLPMYISSFTILLIAIDRYRVILYPLEVRMSRPVAIGLVIGAIAISVISAIPVAYYSELSSPNNSSNFQYCVEKWSSSELRMAYSTWTFTVQFLSPLVITAILYFQIYIRLRRRIVTKKDDEKKKRTNRILMGIVACFAICWTPFAVYSLLLEIRAYVQSPTIVLPESLKKAIGSVNDDDNKLNVNKLLDMLCKGSSSESKINIPEKHIKTIDLVLKVFAMASACINPFLYGWLNESIRDSINKVLGFGRRNKTGAGPSYALASTRYTPGENGPNGNRSAVHLGSAMHLDVTEANGITKTKEEEEEEADILAAEDCEDLPTIIVHSPSSLSPKKDCSN